MRDVAAIVLVVFTAVCLLANPILIWHINRLADKYEKLQ